MAERNYVQTARRRVALFAVTIESRNELRFYKFKRKDSESPWKVDLARFSIAVVQMRRFFMDDSRVCHDAEVQLGISATAAEMDDNLIEILHPLLAPLYERFNFFELPLELVRVEVGRMRANRF